MVPLRMALTALARSQLPYTLATAAAFIAAFAAGFVCAAALTGAL